jgi:hypothetical protein
VITDTLVATANVLDTLGSEDARAGVEMVLAQEPGLVGLQEWGLVAETIASAGRLHVVHPALRRQFRGRAS